MSQHSTGKEMHDVLPNSAVTVFNLVFSLCTFYDCCNASRSVFSMGALNTVIVTVTVIVIHCNLEPCAYLQHQYQHQPMLPWQHQTLALNFELVVLYFRHWHKNSSAALCTLRNILQKLNAHIGHTDTWNGQMAIMNLPMPHSKWCTTMAFLFLWYQFQVN